MTSVSSLTDTSTDKTSDTESASKKLGSDYSQFLKLLTTQLKNQDPTSPMDTAQFTQQLVMYSQVEQQINANKKLDQLVALQQSSTTLQASNYVGKTVTAKGDNVSLPDSGKAEIGYVLPSEAKSVTLTIKDSNGNTVKTLTGSTASGENTVKWDGTSNYGSRVSAGNYSVSVEALSSTGSKLETTVEQIGKVTGISTDDSGNIVLKLEGGGSVKLSAVQGISA